MPSEEVKAEPAALADTLQSVALLGVDRQWNQSDEASNTNSEHLQIYL